MAESSVSIRLTALRREIRRQNASFQECFDFMKAYGIKPQDETNGESLNAAESLRTLTYLRNELPLAEAVTFLKMYLNWLGENVCENVLYVVEIGFLLGEDLEELLRYSEAQEKYKEILEWISKHGSCKTVEALTLSKLAVLTYRLDSKREAKQYYRECFEILQGVMERKEQSSTPIQDVEMKFAMNAFVTCGEFLRFLGKYDSAKKFFLKALDYCPQNAYKLTILNRCSIYAQLYRNERSSNNFENAQVPTYYEAMAKQHFEMFLRDETRDMNDMPQFMRAASLIYACIIIQHCLSMPVIQRKVSTPENQASLLLSSQLFLDHNSSSESSLLSWAHADNALMLALCTRVNFEGGHVDYRTFKEQAEKHVSECIRLLKGNPKNASVPSASEVSSAMCLIAENYLREKNYGVAEKKLKEALQLSYWYKSPVPEIPGYEDLKGNLHFFCVCLYYFLRGHVSKVKAFSKLALKSCRKANVTHKVLLLERLLKSFDLSE